MEILTSSYNDLSWLNWEQKSDKEFLINLFEKHKENGGDVSLPIQHSRSYDGAIELVTLKDYISKFINQPDLFMEDLIERGLINSPYDLFFDSNSGLIAENKGFGLNKMKLGFDKYENVILKSLENFIEKLPNFDDIKGLKYFDYDGVEKINDKNPLFTIADKLNHPKVYDLIFKKFPQSKEQWLKKDRDGSPYLLSACDSKYDECRDYPVAKVFFENNLGCEFFIQNKKLAQNFVKLAAIYGDINILKKILPLIDLNEAESNLYPYDLSLTKAKNKEVLNLLLDNGARFENNITTSSGTNYNVNLIYSDEVKSFDVIEAILDRHPEIVNDVVNNIYPTIKGKKFEILKGLIEKYNFPKDKYDLLSLVENEDELEYLNSKNVSFEICELFCEKAVNKREEGLKQIRNFSKKGVISSKSPNLIFNILKSKPTKSFINYILKNDTSILEQYTLEGVPAWWGANNSDMTTYIAQKKVNLNQTSQDGKPLYYYLIERESHNRQLGANSVINSFFSKCESLDTSYKDPNGNNIMHNLLFRKRFGKDRIDVNLYNMLKKTSSVNIYELMVTQNNEKKTPIEVLVKSETLGGWDGYEIINDFMENNNGIIKLNMICSDGIEIGEHLMNFCERNEELKKEIEVRLLSDKLEESLNGSQIKSKKMKI